MSARHHGVLPRGAARRAALPRILGGLGALFALPWDDPELARAQLAALSRQLPLLYGILIVNAVALAATFLHIAPDLLTIYLPGVLVAAAAIRLVTWLRNRKELVSGLQALQQLRLIMVIAALFGCASTAWAFGLLHYGDDFDQFYVEFYLAVTAISCVFCLMHVRGAALLCSVVGLLPFTVIFTCSGRLVLTMMAINTLLVTVGMIFVMLRNNGDFAALIVSRRELTLRQGETQRLSDENFRLANLDNLSSLPNRRRFFSELDKVLAAAQHEGTRFAVTLLDLDNFKGVNDIYGHAAGDRLISQVALRLRRLVHQNLFIARLGGDKFGAILSACPTDDPIFGFGTDVVSLLRGPCVVGDRLAAISCSLGVAIYPQAGETAEQLFERADYALYHGKQTQKGQMVVFSNEHETVIRRARRVEQAFRAADLEAEMWVAFQPIVDVVVGRIIAFEALARWASVELGPVGPDVFIPIAERIQMIGELTEVLLKKALDGAKNWPVTVGICFNLSAQDLINPTTMAAVRRIMLESSVAPARIEFEVTETALLRDFDQAARALNMLHGLGARISLDDFGTGYASLGYVQRLPLDKIKIDRSFVTDVDVSRTSPNIIKTIVALCRNLDLDCVVEGVETEAQLRVVIALGCPVVQGYLLSRPVPGEAVTRLIDQLSGQMAVLHK